MHIMYPKLYRRYFQQSACRPFYCVLAYGI